MTPELTILALAGLLQFAQMALYSVLANRQVPPGAAIGPRDTPITLIGRAGRAQRAMNNHFEGLILFTIAVLVLHLADKGTGLTATLAWIYLAARLLYVPAYLLGLAPWRSLIWMVGWLASLLMLLMAFF
ncbi:MAG: MAPEG family protein [Rhodobacterales bacterium]|nr:MAPEG family protein [Rhodobacterales bacterium]NCT11746.1 MAPEG family protein [Rhodobacterales bacterium]